MSSRRTLEAQAATINAVLRKHRVPSHVGRSSATARALRFELTAEAAVPVCSVEELAGEFAAALGAAAAQVRREGQSVCVEVACTPPAAQPLRLLPLCDRLAHAPAASAVLGVDSDGAPLLLRLPAPGVGNVLITGGSGTGKTALARTMLTSLAIYNQPRNLQLVLIDPAARGLTPVADLPHVLGDIVATPADALDCLHWLLAEVERRAAAPSPHPTLVVAVDELPELLRQSGPRVEAMLARLTAAGPAAGVHLLACAPTPTLAAVGDVLAACFHARVVGAVADRAQARTAAACDNSGAELLEGKGDFLLLGAGQRVRLQAAWIGPKDLAHAIALLRAGAAPAQWARPQPMPASHAAPPHAGRAAALEKANPAFALYPEATRTLWQIILERLTRF